MPRKYKCKKKILSASRLNEEEKPRKKREPKVEVEFKIIDTPMPYGIYKKITINNNNYYEDQVKCLYLNDGTCVGSRIVNIPNVVAMINGEIIYM